MAANQTRHLGLRRSAFEPKPLFAFKSTATAPPPTLATCYLLGVPQELKDMVYALLEPSEAARLRAVNTEFNDHFRDIFIQHTFGEVCIKLTTEHLASLAEAMNEPESAAQVKVVRVYSHVRTRPLASDDFDSLRDGLKSLLASTPNLMAVTMVGEHFTTGHFALPTTVLPHNGLNCDLRLLLDVLQGLAKAAVKTFTLEGISAYHRLHPTAIRLHHMTFIETLNMSNIGEHTHVHFEDDDDDNDVPGTFVCVKDFVNRMYNSTTSLSFNGRNHKTLGVEMAHMLYRVRLSNLATIRLSNAAFREGDLWEFCSNHQLTLEVIDLSKMSLEGYRFDDLIFGLVEEDVGEELNMSRLQVIRVNQPCETWQFRRDHHRHEEMHCAIEFIGTHHTMDSSYEGWWKREVFEVLGRGNPGHTEYWRDEDEVRPFEKEGVYHQTRGMRRIMGTDELVEESDQGESGEDSADDRSIGVGDEGTEGEEQKAHAKQNENGIEVDHPAHEEGKDQDDEESCNESGDGTKGKRYVDEDELRSEFDEDEYEATGCGEFHHTQRHGWHDDQFYDCTHLKCTEDTWEEFSAGTGTRQSSSDPL